MRRISRSQTGICRSRIMYIILAVASVSLLILQANPLLITDDGNSAMDHISDKAQRIDDETPINLTSEQIKSNYEKDRLGKWNKTRALPGKFLPQRQPRPLGSSSYRTDTNVKKRALTTAVLGVSPKWRSMTDSGVPLSLGAVSPVRAIGTDPEITLHVNRAPVLEMRNDRSRNNDTHHNRTINRLDQTSKDFNGVFKTSSSYKGVWVDKDTAAQRRRLKNLPAAKSFRDEIRELKHEVKLMKAIVEKLVQASHMFTRKDGTVAHKNSKEARSLKLIASRLTARQMIDGHITDSQTTRDGNTTESQIKKGSRK